MTPTVKILGLYQIDGLLYGSETEPPKKPDGKYWRSEEALNEKIDEYKDYLDALALWEGSLLLMGEQDSAIWRITQRQNHSDWSWAFQGAKKAIDLIPKRLSDYEWRQEIEAAAAKELQQGPVRNEYWLTYIMGAEKFKKDRTFYPLELVCKKVEQWRRLQSGIDWEDFGPIGVAIKQPFNDYRTVLVIDEASVTAPPTKDDQEELWDEIDNLIMASSDYTKPTLLVRAKYEIRRKA